MEEQVEQTKGTMVLIAIFVSRFEARLIAGMLEGYGIYSSIDGDAISSTWYISPMTLGGLRLRVCAEDYQAASDILRQSGVLGHGVSAKSFRPILLKILSFWLGIYSITFAIMVFFGAPLFVLVYAPLGVLNVPLDPKGRPDYYLAQPSD